METYCFGYKKNTANETYNHRKTKQNRLMLLSNCAICGKKIKKQEVSRSELHYVAFSNCNNIEIDQFKMNKMVDKVLLTGNKFMPELHLRQPGFTHNACETINKTL